MNPEIDLQDEATLIGSVIIKVPGMKTFNDAPYAIGIFIGVDPVIVN